MLTSSTRSTFHSLLDAAALTAADATQDAIIYVETGQPSQHITRAEFRHQTENYAAALHTLEIKPADLIIIAHTQNLESIYAFWGALKIGAVPSMFPTLTEKLDPAVYQRNMAELVSFSDVKAIFTTDTFAPALQATVSCPVYTSTDLKTQPPTPNPRPPTPNPHHTAFLQHSSGTTGLQKGVALSHTAVLNQLADYSTAINLNAADVIVSWLPLYHDMGLIAGFLLPLVQGIPLVLMSPFDWVRNPALLLQTIDQYKGTLCWLPNFAYNHCARRIRKRDFEGLSLASMRLFINCSEPVRHTSHALFLERFGSLALTAEQLAVSYAMAENTFAVTQTAPGQPPHLDVIDERALIEERHARPAASSDSNALTLVSCGPPIHNTAVRVVDKEGHPLPERHVGEISVRSNCMLTGYHNRPDLDPFQAGWYLTGDEGYMAGGQVYIIGRSKDLIINAGKNVYPQDIEAIVYGVEGVRPGRAVVFGVPDEREGTELIAVVAEVVNADPAVQQQINKAVRQAVAQQSMVTVSYVTLVDDQWLLKTSSGKIARAANRAKWLASRS